MVLLPCNLPLRAVSSSWPLLSSVFLSASGSVLRAVLPMDHEALDVAFPEFGIILGLASAMLRLIGEERRRPLHAASARVSRISDGESPRVSSLAEAVPAISSAGLTCVTQDLERLCDRMG